MNKEQFIYWLKGFTAAVEIQPTEGQWDTIVSELEKIQDCPDYGSPIEEFKPNPIWQEPYYQYPRGPHYQYPSDINKVTYEDLSGVIRSSSSVGTITTNNSTGTTAKPQFSTLTTGGNITTTLAKGATLNYTANLPEEL